MHPGRRTADRRRRVLYSTQTAELPKSSAAGRRAQEKMREARDPHAAYGKRVNRRLRGRWFSLVPVRRRTLGALTIATISITLLLVYAHYLSVTYPWLAQSPSISRPLRLDHTDSFGNWILSMLLVVSAGISFLVYQLRRHRNDDFQGHYRLWRLLTYILIVASLHAQVGLLGWGGGVLDAMLGKRVALTGSDWLRLLILFGGAILALRVGAEVRKSRWALGFLGFGLLFLAIPETVNWNMLEVQNAERWTLVTSAPLLGCTCLFLGFTGYLRMVFREVRRIEDSESVAQILARFKQQWLESFQRDRDPLLDEPRKSKRTKKRNQPDEVDSKSGKKSKRQQRQEQRYEAEEESDDDWDDQETESDISESTDDEPTARTTKSRGWFGLRRRPQSPNNTDIESQNSEDASIEDDEVVDADEEKPRKKRRGWSLRLKPGSRNESESDDDSDELSNDESEESETSDSPKSKKRFGWRRKKREAASDSEPDAEHEETEDADAEPPNVRAPDDGESEDEVDPNDIDWSSLSKSERRRLRKKLKRQNRAA